MVSFPSADDATHQLRELVRTGRFPEALDWYRREEGTAGRQADAQLLAATAATRLGEFTLGERLAREASEKFGARGDLDGRMRALNLLGVIGFELGSLEAAEAQLGEALELAHRLHDSLMAARACNNLASVLHLRGRPEEAVGLYRGALSSYLRLGDRRGTAETYHNLGLTFRQLTEFSEAEKATQQAVRHAEFVGEPALMALTAGGRAELRIAQGDAAFAFSELDRAARLAEKAGDVIGLAEIRRIRALAAGHQEDWGLSRDEAEAALRIAEEHGVALLRAECAALAALAHRALGFADLAESRRREAVEGFLALGAARLLERLEADWAGD
jgi:tetratricopeptide (TPR) repeat protein